MTNLPKKYSLDEMHHNRLWTHPGKPDLVLMDLYIKLELYASYMYWMPPYCFDRNTYESCVWHLTFDSDLDLDCNKEVAFSSDFRPLLRQHKMVCRTPGLLLQCIDVQMKVCDTIDLSIFNSGV